MLYLYFEKREKLFYNLKYNKLPLKQSPTKGQTSFRSCRKSCSLPALVRKKSFGRIEVIKK